MESKNLLTLAITLTVGIILAGSLLMPVLNDYSEATKTYENVGMPYAAVDEGTHTITVTATSITVDGTEIDMSLFPGNFEEYTLVYGEESFVRLNITGHNIRACSTTFRQYAMTNGETVTIAIDGTEVTVSSTNTGIQSTTYTDGLYYISSTGDYVLSLNPAVASNTTMFGAGGTYFSAGVWSIPDALVTYITWAGDISGITVDLLNFTDTAKWSDCEVGTSKINTTALNENLFRIDSILIPFTATNIGDSESYEVTATYSYFLVPHIVTYDNPNYLGSAEATIIAAIPILVIMGLVIMAAGSLYLKRED